jgi:endonuclease/exonuclease/phosphatase (EEP) superfamily protein YafD
MAVKHPTPHGRGSSRTTLRYARRIVSASGSTSSPWIRSALAAAAPWSWFLVRNLGWVAEPFAVAFPLLVLLGVALSGTFAIVGRNRRTLMVTASILALAIVVVAGPRRPQTTAAPIDPLRVVSANVFDQNSTPLDAARALASTDADVLVAVETGREFPRMLADADSRRPFVVTGPGIVVRAQYPLRVLPLSSSLPEERSLRVLVERPAGSVVLYAVHALNPAYQSTFARQLSFVTRLSLAAERETDPVVIAGDFNMSDRQLGYRRMTSVFRDAARAGWASNTYDFSFWRLLMLRIDFVFVERSWCAARSGRVDVPGSDHQGVVTTIGPCPSSEG